MNKVQVLIVEDEFIVAEDIRRNLIKLSYTVNEMARSGEEALELLKKNVPDIVLLDINLGSGMSGIETAVAIRKIVHIPIIYVTAHSDAKTFENAKETAPDAYIIKPFNFSNLHSAMELAIYNYSRMALMNADKLVGKGTQDKKKPGQYLFNGSIFIKIGKGFDKVKFKDVCYIKAEGSYSRLFTEEREFTLALNLHTVLDRLNRPEFLRVHRSYVVHLNNIDKIEENGVWVKGVLVPTSKKKHDELLRKLGSL